MQRYFRIFILNLLNLWILPSACPVLGQARQMTYAAEKDYPKWGTLDIKNLSEKGKWVSFEMNYENKSDTLFISETSGKKTFSFPKGHNGHFGSGHFFFLQDPDSNLKLFDLHSFKTSVIKDVTSYEIALKGKYLLTVNDAGGKNSCLIIRDSTGRGLDTIKGITEYLLNKNGDALLFSAQYDKLSTAGIIYFKNYRRITITDKSPYKLFSLCWQKEDQGAAFLAEKDSASGASLLNYFRVRDSRLFSFDIKTKEQDADLIISQRDALLISDDGKKVFFTQTRDKTLISKGAVDKIEIWNGNDNRLYPSRQHSGTGRGIPKKAFWSPDSGFYLQINDDTINTFGITGRQDYALVYDKNPYALQDIYYEQADFYLKELGTGSTVRFLEKQTIDPNQVLLDPLGSRIVYYRERNWWIYDINKGKHICLTRGIETSWDNSNDYFPPNQFGTYGFAAWSDDGKNILLYDEFDIWLAALDGSSSRRLTKGREQNISFRLYDPSHLQSFSQNEDLMLLAENQQDLSCGYYSLSFRSGEKALVYTQKKLSQLLKGENNILIYKSETYSMSPQIEVKKKKRNPYVLFESNRHQKKYYFGRSELLYYKGHNGKKLRAALFWPAGFDPSKKYPMIVHIYDKQSVQLNSYVNPTALNSIGFNVSNYTLNDYFVLLPDMFYRTAEPGISAVESVTASVDAALQIGYIDKSGIGLYGHSFGGYETNFIITQTPIFAAAVSGAGISDIISYYFNISKNGNFKSEMWRFESQQFRMGKSLYDDKESYLRNDPLLNAEKVTTPLLLWSGKDDRVVPYTQSISYYLALRRLKKDTLMLFYPNEDHNLHETANQTDLSARIMDWFDYYLKKQKNKNWIREGISAH